MGRCGNALTIAFGSEAIALMNFQVILQAVFGVTDPGRYRALRQLLLSMIDKVSVFSLPTANYPPIHRVPSAGDDGNQDPLKV